MNLRFLVVGILVILLFSAFAVGTEGAGIHKNSVEKNSAGSFGKIVEINGVRYITHDVIRINNDTDFANQASQEGWPGDGTQGNPYIISGYDIDAHGAGDAIYIGNTTVYFVVENCYLHNASHDSWPYFLGDGITLYNVMNGTVKNNICSENNMGIDELGYSKNNLIYNNSCINNDIGILLILSRNNKLYRNKMINDGIELIADKDTFTTQNISTNNTVNDKPVYYFKNANMNNASVPADAGQVILGNVSWLKIENLYISNTSVAIEVGYSSHIIIRNNTCTNNEEGIRLDSSNSNVISNNTCNHNIGLDMLIEYSNNNIISNNTCNDSNGNGTLLLGSYSNLIFDNLFANNSNYGIYIYSGSHNHIYNNTFFYNQGSGDKYNSSHIQAYDSGANNWWNSTSGIGNYWHDWANNNDTNDLNPQDGIVDWPYRIGGSAGAKDYYPLKNTSVKLPPLPPRNLNAIAGKGYVNLTWDAPRGNGTSPITNYKIYRDGALVGIVPVTQLYYNDTSVTNGQTYTYYVTANNSVGESDKSNEVQATPGEAIPEFSTGIWMAILILISLLGVVRFRKSS